MVAVPFVKDYELSVDCQQPSTDKNENAKSVKIVSKCQN